MEAGVSNRLLHTELRYRGPQQHLRGLRRHQGRTHRSPPTAKKGPLPSWVARRLHLHPVSVFKPRDLQSPPRLQPQRRGSDRPKTQGLSQLLMHRGKPFPRGFCSLPQRRPGILSSTPRPKTCRQADVGRADVDAETCRLATETGRARSGACKPAPCEARGCPLFNCVVFPCSLFYFESCPGP